MTYNILTSEDQYMIKEAAKHNPVALYYISRFDDQKAYVAGLLILRMLKAGNNVYSQDRIYCDLYGLSLMAK